MGLIEPTNQLTVRENIEMLFPDENPMLFMDGLDDAIIGYCDKEMKVIYSATKIIDELMHQGMNDEEAIEYFAKVKQLPRKEFLKVFLVTEIK